MADRAADTPARAPRRDRRGSGGAPGAATISPRATGPAPVTPAAWHWEARATTIAAIEAALARFWATAAQEAESDGVNPRETAEARGDPRLAGHLEDGGDVRVRTRTSVLTLVVVAARPETASRALATMQVLEERHPSRMVILAPGDPDGPSALDARISLTCHPRRGSVSETCAERIVLHTGGELAQHLAGVATPLLIHDLPVVVWWPDDPPIGSRLFRELVETSDEVLLDSGAFRDDGTRRLTALAALVADERVAARDIGWMRLTLWRELLAGLFDHPLLAPELPSVKAVRIDVAQPGKVLRVSKPLLFAGWLAGMLGWGPGDPLTAKEQAGSLVGSWTHERRHVRLELRPVHALDALSLRSSGSLVRVELELGTARHPIRARVVRQPDHLLATADWNGAEVIRRAGRLEPFDEAPYVAEALDEVGHDRIFEQAVLGAARLLAG